MGIDVVLSGGCEARECTLLAGVGRMPGVDTCVRWKEWRPEKVGGQEVFVVVGAEYCERGAGQLAEWFRRLLDIGRQRPALRMSPILVVSPHATRWVRDLCDETGMNLTFEPNVHLISLRHDTSPVTHRTRVCELDETVAQVRGVVQRLLLVDPWKRHDEPRSSVGRANADQADSVLARRASQLHYLLHDARSGSPSTPQQAAVNALAYLKDASDDLQRFVTGGSVAEFVEEAKRALDSRVKRGDTEEDILHWVSSYLEESAAILRLEVESKRREAKKRVRVLVVDDDAAAGKELALRVPSPNLVDATYLELPKMSGRIATTLKCGGDASEVVAQAVYESVVGYLEMMHARDEWVQDCTRFVLVVDVRLDPQAPKAGLGLIRRVRDSHPFVITCALTVRTGLAYDLADEGANAYVVKRPDREGTVAAAWKAIEAATWNSATYYSAPGTEDLIGDKYLRALIESKYLLKRAISTDESSPRLILCTPANWASSVRAVGPGTTVGIAVDHDVDPGVAAMLLRSCREDWQRRAVILRRVANHKSGQCLYPSSVLQLDSVLQPGVATKYDARWTLLVPRSWRCGELHVEVAEEQLSGFRRLVSERFGGATAGEAEGVWIRPDDRLEVLDVLERIEVLGRGTEAGRRYLIDLARRVVNELGQEEVFLQEQKVRNWTLGPAFPLRLPATMLDTEGRLLVRFAAAMLMPSLPTTPAS